MVTPEMTVEILRLFHVEKWKVDTIVKQLGIHHDAVERVIETNGVPAPRSSRPSIVDPFVPFIREVLEKYPTLTASRLLQMVKERGYRGKPSRFREVVAKLRNRPSRENEAFLRIQTLPAEQAQVDWASFGKMRVGLAERLLCAFVMVLSHSRAIFLRFFFGQHLSNFLRGHEAAFAEWTGIPRVLLYDNLKSVVMRRVGSAIQFNTTFLSFAGHYRFEPRPVAIRRGNEKGRVERAIRYVREGFFAARKFKDLDDLNRQAETWFRNEAMTRNWPDDPTRTVSQAFQAEQRLLLPLPADAFPTEERVEVSVGKTPYVRFDGNDYSVPHHLVRRTLVVLATLDHVRILDGPGVVATHRRTFNRRQHVEDPEHLRALLEEKREAREHRGINLLFKAAPQTVDLLQHLAERGANLGNATHLLVNLLDLYGVEAFTTAVAEALENNVPHPSAVRHVLERNRLDMGLPPALPLSLPDDPRVRDLDVKPHSLDTYDQIRKDLPDDDGTTLCAS